jgi:hypothetical protein
MSEQKANTFKHMPPGVAYPWAEKVKQMSEIKGDPEIIKNQWENIDAMAYIFAWYWVQR